MKNSLRVQIPAFISIRVVINTMTRMVYPFLPVFGRGLGVDLWLLSLALTLRSGVGVLGPFLASVGDSRGRKTGMLLGVFLFTAGASLVAIWPSYPAFVLTLVLTMLGNLAFIPSMQAYLGDRIPYRRRGLVLALSELGWSISFIAGVPAVGLLIARWGWHSPFPFLAFLGLLALGLLAWMVTPDKKEHRSKSAIWLNLRTVLTYGPALAGVIMGMFLSSANEVISLVFGVWMEDSFGLQVAALGAASAVIGVSELGGEALAGGLADRLGKNYVVGAGLILNSLAALALPLIGGGVFGALVGLFLFYITFEFTVVSSIPLMTEVLPAARATLMATFIAGMALGRAAGALLAAPLYTQGFLACALAAMALNLLALVALRSIRVSEVRAVEEAS